MVQNAYDQIGGLAATTRAWAAPVRKPRHRLILLALAEGTADVPRLQVETLLSAAKLLEDLDELAAAGLVQWLGDGRWAVPGR